MLVHAKSPRQRRRRGNTLCAIRATPIANIVRMKMVNNERGDR
jgi:hypothetical protein